ncbi:MAG: type I methionyl aminopeptidase [Actinomycetia bacterium]|nr:type I methionyl aminopeptidase [Actinomycetes bacterium]MCP4224392.1 type I methionyl aminopeptidase [Actinomycetes bacterium]MCP5030722.1 type I methionyl aminopeptidase [Actinomycetes bacterium]
MRVLPKANELCWCGSGKKFKRCHKQGIGPVRAGRVTPMRPVPDTITKPSWADGGVVDRWDEPRVKSADVIERMRRTGVEAADTLAMLGTLCQPGVTTDEIDIACHEESIRRNAYPSPLGYPGSGDAVPYPKSLCTSVNEIICHGIPDDRPLVDGDIINLDVTLYKDGVHGDTNATFFVGEADDLSRRLVTATRDSLMRGIDAARPGDPINNIGRAIQEYAEGQGFGVVRDFVGHGIGEQFHTDLQICHYFHPRLTDVIEPGMTFTVEPMITAGSWQAKLWSDGWTAATIDGGRTAQFEHTILITDDGPEILTTPTDLSTNPYWTL